MQHQFRWVRLAVLAVLLNVLVRALVQVAFQPMDEATAIRIAKRAVVEHGWTGQAIYRTRRDGSSWRITMHKCRPDGAPLLLQDGIHWIDVNRVGMVVRYRVSY
jgi:membrane protein implicated in regulation of membrane protease activity